MLLPRMKTAFGEDEIFQGNDLSSNGAFQQSVRVIPSKACLDPLSPSESLISSNFLHPFLPALPQFWLRRGAEKAIPDDELLSEMCYGCVSLTHLHALLSHGWIC